MNKGKLFKNGDSQAARLPVGFRFTDKEVYIKKVGNTVGLMPASDSVNALWQTLDDFSEDCFIQRNQPKGFDRRE